MCEEGVEVVENGGGGASVKWDGNAFGEVEQQGGGASEECEDVGHLGVEGDAAKEEEHIARTGVDVVGGEKEQEEARHASKYCR